MKLYTIRELSKILNIPQTTLRSFVYRKMIKTYPVEGHILVPDKEVDKIKAWREKINKKGRPKCENPGGTV